MKEDVKVFCPNCGSKVDDDSKYCDKCGTSLKSEESNINKKAIYENKISIEKPTNEKQTCISCKGKGKKINKIHAAISLILGLIVIPVIALYTGGTSLLLSVGLLVWGLSKKKCKTCNGVGYKMI